MTEEEDPNMEPVVLCSLGQVDAALLVGRHSEAGVEATMAPDGYSGGWDYSQQILVHRGQLDKARRLARKYGVE